MAAHSRTGVLERTAWEVQVRFLGGLLVFFNSHQLMAKSPPKPLIVCPHCGSVDETVDLPNSGDKPYVIRFCNLCKHTWLFPAYDDLPFEVQGLAAGELFQTKPEASYG